MECGILIVEAGMNMTALIKGHTEVQKAISTRNHWSSRLGYNIQRFKTVSQP